MKSRVFNLLEPIQPPLTLWDRVYIWVTNQARIVIAIVIILLTIAFFAKVIVDTEAKNKTKQIGNLMNQISFYSESIEPKIRSLIRRVDVYDELNQSSSQLSEILDEVYQILGTSSNELTVSVKDNRLIIYGTEDLVLLKDLERFLRTSQNFKSVNFDSLIVQREESNYSYGQYSITAVIKKEKQVYDRLKFYRSE
ncbi:hypothetical protein D6810_02745 [Candidatus Dojkabacteria bacterium]|uniref:PilN domain-containing protein n=1 Tax=Candidatus Dojkabacteria bacterium TaxID=2099670 RepID=A0A3M0YXH5_9BACT|nr:MAG: hypothetical protein D6810_02745 [Candidatus Dojkabacteria bacterium]